MIVQLQVNVPLSEVILYLHVTKKTMLSQEIHHSTFNQVITGPYGLGGCV